MNAEKKKLEWEKQKLIIDKLSGALLNPAGLLIVGFVATNFLQNTHMKYVEKHGAGYWSLNPFLPQLPGHWVPAETGITDMTWITADQANLLRGGLVASFAVGGAEGVINAIKGLIK